MTPKYILVTESALDAALISGGFSKETGLLTGENGVHEILLCESVKGYRIASEPEVTYFALVGIKHLEYLMAKGGTPSEIFQRIARVLKGLRSPPVHLPRQWSEYHYGNLLAFFSLPRDIANARWIVELDGLNKRVLFDFLSSDMEEVDLAQYLSSDWPSELDNATNALLSAKVDKDEDEVPDALSQEVDLHAIGSGSVVGGRTYEEWERYLTPRQGEILQSSTDASIRIVGPAGSGKTLSLCMRALQISREASVIAQGKRVLVATHSWAMSERIDGILNTLNGSNSHDGVTVFPLLFLLELHAGHIGHRRIEVIGDDSTDGRLKSLEIIAGVVSKSDASKYPGLSPVLTEGLVAAQDSRRRLDLVINLYEELSGVLTASGVAVDDPNSIQEYMSAKREDWMPPFVSVADRGFAVSIYKQFIQNLVDRAAITTDQFILDSIRVLETFTWRMRKETDGYDFILIDELQLFDPQERSALELLGRSRRGVPFVTAEDPSQGVFSALNTRKSNVDNVPVYLDIVHRFNREIFEFISFMYQKFPLNALPLKIAETKGRGEGRPRLIVCEDDGSAILKASDIVREVMAKSSANERICVVTLGDVDAEIADKLKGKGLTVVRLESFDDVEKLSYLKRSIVISPWQFIGGTQFPHVVVLVLGIVEQTSQFGRLREMIAVYLSCSRATDSLNLICASYIPPVLAEASENGLLVR